MRLPRVRSTLAHCFQTPPRAFHIEDGDSTSPIGNVVVGGESFAVGTKGEIVDGGMRNTQFSAAFAGFSVPQKDLPSVVALVRIGGRGDSLAIGRQRGAGDPWTMIKAMVVDMGESARRQ